GATVDDAGTPGMLAFLAHRGRVSAPVGPARLAVVATDEDDLRQKLAQAAQSIAAAPASAFSLPAGLHYAHDAAPGGVALLFPGQGSQALGMGADGAMAFEEARAVWDRAADIPMGGTRLHAVVFPPPAFGAEARARLEARLTATEWVQPALGVASAALLAVLRAIGLEAAATAGHSFG